MLEFYNSFIRKARKPHKCEYCEKEIAAGEKYSYESGKFEGDFFTRTLCIPCNKILASYMRSSVDDTFDWWQVTDFLFDTHCNELCGQDIRQQDCSKVPERCEKIRAKFSEN